MMLRANQKSYVDNLEPRSNEDKLPIDEISPSLRILSEDVRNSNESYVDNLEPRSNEDKLPIDEISPSLRILSEDVRNSNEDVTRSELNPTTKPKRRSIVIFGDDRSGTTLLTRMFSEDSNVFSVYEPLWITRKWRATEPDRDRVKDVTDVVSALMSCNFVDNPTAMKFLAHTSKRWAPGLFKNPFQSPPICNGTEKGKITCPSPETVPRLVEEACSRHYKHSVTKLAIVRVPERKLSNIFPRIIYDNPDTEIKILHVVRDPRGSINSRINLGWIKEVDKAKNFAAWPKDTCEGITQNVKYGASLEGSLKNNYMLVKYKDIAFTPVLTAMKIYKFAGFEMQESLIRWIIQATSPNKETLDKEAKKAFSSFRNSTANAEKWRQQSPMERTRIIEQECGELLDLLHLERLT